MLRRPLQIAFISVSIFCMNSSFAFAANLQHSKLANNIYVDRLSFQKTSFWGLPYPYGFVWRPCYVWRSVLTRYGHRRWYRIRLSSDECRL